MAIQFDLIQLGRHGRAADHIDRRFEPSAFTHGADADDNGYAIVGPVHLVIDVRKDGDLLRLTGHVAGLLRLECGRCLDPFDIPIDAPFELRYLPSEASAGEDEREVGGEDLTTAYYRDHTIDLEDLMREQFQLALPMKPLCADACKGLCPHCGANRNTAPCNCRPAWEESRLAGLKSLLDHSNES